jgi:hypothetical protein
VAVAAVEEVVAEIMMDVVIIEEGNANGMNDNGNGGT